MFQVSRIFSLYVLWWAITPVTVFADIKRLLRPGASLNGVTLINCSGTQCIKIEATEASESFLVRGLSFGPTKLTIIDSKSGNHRFLPTNNTFFDYESNCLYLEGLNGDFSQEAIYELSTGKLKRF